MNKLFRFRATINGEEDNHLILAQSTSDGIEFLVRSGALCVRCIREIKLSEYTQYNKSAMKELANCAITGYASCVIKNKEYRWVIDGIINKWQADWRKFDK